MSFERGLIELKRIVDKLESEDIDLETAVADFEKGMKIQRYCKKKLDEATLQVNYLLKDQDLKPLHTHQYSKSPQQSPGPTDSLDFSDLE
jgi:exodeoxyribonuclease VII small subunit